MRTTPLLACVLLCACTSLGPMPATTGISAVPVNRPGVEAQGGFMPGFYLSQATHEPKGAPIAQLSSLIEPDRWIGIPGLIVGARIYGPNRDLYLEPYAGYRHQLTERLALAGVAYGSAGHGTQNLATYHASRVGGEAAADVLIVKPTNWLGVHAHGAVSGSYVRASGTYCVDANGVGVDCDTSTGAMNTTVDGTMRGAYFTATGAVAIDAGRLATGAFHLARVSALASVGTMPRVRGGSQQSGDTYATIGLALTLGFGAGD